MSPFQIYSVDQRKGLEGKTKKVGTPFETLQQVRKILDVIEKVAESNVAFYIEPTESDIILYLDNLIKLEVERTKHDI